VRSALQCASRRDLQIGYRARPSERSTALGFFEDDHVRQIQRCLRWHSWLELPAQYGTDIGSHQPQGELVAFLEREETHGKLFIRGA
jgi:hypothetical protein